MMNKLKAVFVAIFLLIIGYTTAYAADIGLYLDGKVLNTDVAPIIVRNRSFVPVRSIFEKLGAEVTWINSRKQVIIRSANARIVLNVNSTTAYVNDDSVELDVAPFIKDGRTMVPVRFISESLNYDVKWENNTIYITTKKTESPNKTSAINKINVFEKGDTTEISILASNLKKPTISYAQSPTRFIADFPATTMTLTGSKVVTDTPEVTEVRYALHPDYMRVVIESPVEVTYSTKYSGNTMTISVKAKKSSASENEDELPDKENTEQVVPTPDIEQSGTLVVLDPGHGGSDCGAIGYDENGEEALYESEVNLAIAREAYDKLVSYGLNVVMTRDDDTELGESEMEDLLARSDIANSMGATFFVSIHCNSFTEPTATGTEVLYADMEDKIYDGVTSKQLAQNILTPLLKATGLSDRGIKDSPKMVVLRTTTMPSVLIETAFLSNPDDMKILADEDKIYKIGNAIAEGIIKSIAMLED